MRVMQSEDEFIGSASVVALGMFDGVHIGHQKLIRTAIQLAQALDVTSVVCTFDRHPMCILYPERAPEPILPLAQNLEKFEALGAECALVKPFTAEFGAMPPEAYLAMLKEKMRVRAIVVGENYSFGSGGRGNPQMICELAKKLDYEAVVVPPVMDDGVMASSTYVRRLLREGDLAHAERLLRIEAHI